MDPGDAPIFDICLICCRFFALSLLSAPLLQRSVGQIMGPLASVTSSMRSQFSPDLCWNCTVVQSTQTPFVVNKRNTLDCDQSNYSSRIVFSHIPIEFVQIGISAIRFADPENPNVEVSVGPWRKNRPICEAINSKVLSLLPVVVLYCLQST